MVCLNGWGNSKNAFVRRLLHRSIHVVAPQFDQVIVGGSIWLFVNGALVLSFVLLFEIRDFF